MKSRIWITLIALLVVFCLAIPTLAAGENRGCRNNSQCVANNFVDQNDDDICDNRTQQSCVNNATCNKGENFVDEDNDGVCDNRTQ